MNLKKLFPRLFDDKGVRIRKEELAPRLKGSSNPKDLLAKAQEVGETAREWAEAFCLPEERQGLPEEQLTPEEKECIRKAGSAFQREVAEALGIR